LGGPESISSAAAPTTTLLLGCDFSSAPNAKKQIVLAVGALNGGRLQLLKLERFPALESFANWLQVNHSWLGAFDLPFGLPRELVQILGWPDDWPSCVAHFASLSRAQIRAEFSAFCNARPAGGKFAHRATDRVAPKHEMG
jgi:hypothetical protein